MSVKLADIPVSPARRETIRAGALVAVNHSGGKDSHPPRAPSTLITASGFRLYGGQQSAGRPVGNRPVAVLRIDSAAPRCRQSVFGDGRGARIS